MSQDKGARCKCPPDEPTHRYGCAIGDAMERDYDMSQDEGARCKCGAKIEHAEDHPNQCCDCFDIECGAPFQQILCERDAAAYARGKADAEQQVREAVLRDAARGRFVVEHAAWHRDAGRTFLAIEVPSGSNLSCVALREDALDAAIRARSTAQGGGVGD